MDQALLSLVLEDKNITILNLQMKSGKVPDSLDLANADIQFS